MRLLLIVENINNKKYLGSTLKVINLKNTTFIIPIMIDTKDRLENIDVIINYILHYFDTNIIVKEFDTVQKYQNDKIKYIFEQNQNNFFHKTKLLNDMMLMANTEFIFNYDADILLPVRSYTKCVDMLNNGYDVIYPYGDTNSSQILVNRNFSSFKEFKKLYDVSILNDNKTHQAKYGFCFCIRKKIYIKSFLENENFKSYGPEDWERSFRFKKLGLNLGRVKDKVYHIEHCRTKESNKKNPFFIHNNKLWIDIQKMDKKQLIEYYQNQSYFKQICQKLNIKVECVEGI